jgi:hypothetical protein
VDAAGEGILAGIAELAVVVPAIEIGRRIKRTNRDVRRSLRIGGRDSGFGFICHEKL